MKKSCSTLTYRGFATQCILFTTGILRLDGLNRLVYQFFGGHRWQNKLIALHVTGEAPPRVTDVQGLGEFHVFNATVRKYVMGNVVDVEQAMNRVLSVVEVEEKTATNAMGAVRRTFRISRAKTDQWQFNSGG